MASLTVSDDTYSRLAARAAALNVSVEDLAAPVLERLAGGAADAPASPPGDIWVRGFNELLAAARGRAALYPPGFQADVSREGIYAGCGE